MAERKQSPDGLALVLMSQLVGQALASQGASSLATLYQQGKDALRAAIRRDPIDANLSFVVGASALFYAVERGVNPKVNTFGDALIYITTCLSVGYSDIFAKTEAGKLLGSMIMTIGPALSGMFLDEPARRDAVGAVPRGREPVPAQAATPTPTSGAAPGMANSTAGADPDSAVYAAMLSRMDEILVELRRIGAGAPDTRPAS